MLVFCVAVFNSLERMHGTQHTRLLPTLSPLLTSVTFVPQARPVAGLQAKGKLRESVVCGDFSFRHERECHKTHLFEYLRGTVLAKRVELCSW